MILHFTMYKYFNVYTVYYIAEGYKCGKKTAMGNDVNTICYFCYFVFIIYTTYIFGNSCSIISTNGITETVSKRFKRLTTSPPSSRTKSSISGGPD